MTALEAMATEMSASNVLPSRAPAGRRGRPVELCFLAAALLLAAVAYWPITRNYFYTDDFLNLYDIVNDPLLQYLVTPNGGHMLLVRNAVFRAMFQLFGTHPEYYFACVLLTHLVNVWLLFRLVGSLTGSLRLASFGAALWGISPLSEGALGWYSVYGHVMVATALLIVLCQAARAAAEGHRPSRRQLWLWFGLALVAATSFGTGIAVALELPFVLLLLLPAGDGTWWRRRPPLLSLLVAVPLLYVALNWLYLRLSGESMLLRTSLLGVGNPLETAAVCLRLAGYGLVRLVGGFSFPAWAAETAVWYGAEALLAVAALAVGWTSPPPLGRRLAAFALLAFGCYGIVAAGRARLLFDLAPEFFETLTRYHYVGQLALAVLLCLLIQRAGSLLRARAKDLAVAAWYAGMITAFVLSPPAIDHHARTRRLTGQTLAALRRAVRSRPVGRTVYIPNRGFPALLFFPALFPGSAAIFAIFHPSNVLDGRRVYFVESNPAVLEAAKRGRRTKDLLVPPRHEGR